MVCVCVCHFKVMALMKLQCEKAYQLQAVQEPADFESTLVNLNALALSDEHVRFWWFPHTRRAIVWRAHRVYNVRWPT
jgi:hypothetical protein